MDDHDRGLAYDVRVMSRRRLMALIGAAGTASVAAACSNGDNATTTTTTTTATSNSTSTATSTVAAAPQETAGPYPGDGSNGPNVLVESGVLRSDIRTSFGAYSGVAEGVPMTLRMTMRDLVGDRAGAGMAVYVWHCDRSGAYSLYNVADRNYLRGVQVAGDDGVVTFTSIFPACYAGRWPHIHFEVFDSLTAAVAGDNARLTSQIALPQDACTAVFESDQGYAQSTRNMSGVSLARDNVFGDGWDAELATVTGSPASGMTVAITIGVG